MTAAPRTRVQRRPVHGVVLLDKPLGLSSNQALQKVKWLLRAEKAGHTGTLDPLATGVLPLCFGAATKFSQLHLDADKTYEAVLRLGQTTATGDAKGEVLQERPVNVTQDQITAVLQQFMGEQQQLPPMYSALKKDGKALYEYARAGETVERTPRHITVFALEQLSAWTGEPVLTIRAAVSKGTYIRSLAEDIGEALGCGAHLIGLRRVQTGAFGLQHCITLEALEAMPEGERLQALLPTDILLQGFTPVELDNDNAGRFLSGLRRRVRMPNTEHVAVYGQQPKALLRTARRVAREVIPVRLLTPVEIADTLKQPPSSFLSL